MTADATSKLISLLSGDALPAITPQDLVSTYVVEFTGSAFESYGMNQRDAISADDLIAVTMLSIRIGLGVRGGIEPSSALAMEAHAPEIGSLLAEIPNAAILPDLTDERFTEFLGPESAAWQLFDLLRSDRIGLPSVATHKLMARKRPLLIPVKDGQVPITLFGTAPKNWWIAMRDLAGDPVVKQALADFSRRLPLRAQHLSAIRLIDIVAWHGGRHLDGACKCSLRES